MHSVGQTRIYLTAVILQYHTESPPIQHRTFCHRQMEAIGQKVLDFVLTRVKFRVSVFNLLLNWNFHFGSCARLTLKQWHTSAKVTGVEVPVLICQILSAWEWWMCLCKSLRMISSCFLHIVRKEFFLIFVWRIYLIQSLEGDYFFSLCKLCLVWFSLLLRSISNREADLHSHLHLKQAQLWSRASPRGTTHGSALLWAQCTHCNSQVLW